MKANSKSVSVAPKAGSPQPPAPTSGSFGGPVPSVPAHPRSTDGLPSDNEGSALFTRNPDVDVETKAGVVRALKAADAAADSTFKVG